jgi:zinc protease
MHGDYKLLFSAPEAYERVTREDVASIARTVFNADKRTVGVLLPTGGEDAGGALEQSEHGVH